MKSSRTESDSFLIDLLQDPYDRSHCEKIEAGYVFFASGRKYPLNGTVPVLIDEEKSIFRMDEILKGRVTTQSAQYRDRTNIKNYVRQAILPTLSVDSSIRQRYEHVATLILPGPVLIIGTGDKGRFYRDCFSNSNVVTSDIHCLFGVDYVFDAHSIPFKDETFSLVLLSQVLEHTVRPWIVAAELERVTREGGHILVEVPFCFPLHSEPFDFYRFTPSALHFLFPACSVLDLTVPEGNWSASAVSMSQAMIDMFTNRYLRMITLAISRVCLWWMKYLDKLGTGAWKRIPKGYSILFRKDGKQRDDRTLLQEILSRSRTSTS